MLKQLTRSQAKCFSHELEMRIDKIKAKSLLWT
jgi:hypothetical protein